MKKLVAVALVLCMTISLAGCGKGVAKNQVFSIDDLPEKTIGVQLGTTGDIYAADYEEQGSTVERYNKGNDAIQSLKQGKVDCVIIDEQPAKAFIAKNDDLKIIEGSFDPEEYAICIAKENTDLKEKINQAIDALKAEGTLDAIIGNYIGDDTKGKTPYKSLEGTDRSNGTLVMATNAAFEPYEYYDNQKVVGIDADLAQAICDKLGMELKIEDMEFDGIINAVQSGKADIGVAGMTVTEDRLISIDFTNSYTIAQQAIVVRKK
ncbi:MAG: transporter substrate-binding domain-containing protein [Velocimicrobium sp.]